MTMPRGQYDRSKTKEQRATEKATVSKKATKTATATAAPAKRKYTKKALVEKSLSAAPVKGVIKSALIGQALITRDNDFLLLQEARANLHMLVAVADKFGDLPSVKTEAEAHVQLVSKLRERVFDDVLPKAEELDVSEAQTTDEGSEEEETQTASNGASAYQTTVPLPPPTTIAPPPVIPAH
jgi:hypothetical protein